MPMHENGTEKHSTIWRDVTEQVSDHLDLAALELRFESQQAIKKLLAVAVCGMLVLTGFIVLQVSLVGAMMRFGLSLGVSALVLSLVYFALAMAVYWILGRRDKRAGPPFIGTQKELHETLRWIQKILS